MPLYGARVEYATHTLLNLALAPSGTAPSARDLADFQRLPVPFMRKLLTQLEKSHLIVASEGIRGGWRLSYPPEQISLLAIAEAAHGRDSLFECREIRARCALWPDEAPPRAALSGTCEIHAVMLGAERAMRTVLDSQTLADIAMRMSAKSPRFAGTDVPDWFAMRYAGRRSSTHGPTAASAREAMP
jgi:Rrf2 family protein